MTDKLLPGSFVRKVTSRPVTGKAAQFLYFGNPDETRRHAERIVAVLDVKISTSYDSQSGTGYHLDLSRFDSRLIGHGDWIVVDAFGKASIMPEEDFKTYYEPALTD